MSVKCDHGTAVPSPWLVEGNVPRTQAVLPRWTATEMRWRRKLFDQTSLQTAAILRPSNLGNKFPCALTPYARCFNGKWYEVNAADNTGVFANFLGFRRRCR